MKEGRVREGGKSEGRRGIPDTNSNAHGIFEKFLCSLRKKSTGHRPEIFWVSLSVSFSFFLSVSPALSINFSLVQGRIMCFFPQQSLFNIDKTREPTVHTCNGYWLRKRTDDCLGPAQFGTEREIERKKARKKKEKRKNE